MSENTTNIDLSQVKNNSVIFYDRTKISREGVRAAFKTIPLPRESNVCAIPIDGPVSDNILSIVDEETLNKAGWVRK